jgi:alpha,alpha-trehalase
MCISYVYILDNSKKPLFYPQYDAENPGRYGGGGEYTVQSGFGWTNGVIFELLNKYGLLLTSARRRGTNHLRRG